MSTVCAANTNFLVDYHIKIINFIFLNSYEFMLRCWAQEADVRPTFRQVADEIHVFMSTEGDEQTTDDGTPLTNNISVNSASEFI